MHKGYAFVPIVSQYYSMTVITEGLTLPEFDDPFQHFSLFYPSEKNTTFSDLEDDLPVLYPLCLLMFVYARHRNAHTHLLSKWTCKTLCRPNFKR